jgi:hypothetical protein
VARASQGRDDLGVVPLFSSYPAMDILPFWKCLIIKVPSSEFKPNYLRAQNIQIVQGK